MNNTNYPATDSAFAYSVCDKVNFCYNSNSSQPHKKILH